MTSTAPYDFRDETTRGGYSAVTSAPDIQPSKRNKKWILVGGIALVLLIVVGVTVGVVVSKNKKHNTGLSSNGSGSGAGTPNNPVNQTNPNDPSTFQKDPRLHRSFYGIAYEPEGSLLPDCGNSLAQVITDIQLLSQLTPRLRLYGADCNQSALVLEAIKQTKVDMKVFLANYPNSNDNNTAYDRQRDLIIDAIKTYGTTNIGGIIVGNEFMLNYLTDAGQQDPNSPIGNQGAALLIADINDTRSALAALNPPANLPVGNSEAGAYYNTLVMQAMDFGMANVHPWFGHVSIADAATWTWDFFQQTDVAAATVLPNNPQMYIAETGWPSASDDAASLSDGPSIASEANLQSFLDTFVCQANSNGTKYFFFEYFDETWQAKAFGGVEGHWGLFYSNRTLKGITIPNCQTP